MKCMVMQRPMGMGERIKGAWSKEEDDLLRHCIQRYGEGKWHLVPQRAGLNRCRKSCRLRWVNYLRPNIKRGNFNEDEIDMIMRFHRLLGNRWSLIAARFPGRTSNDVKNLYNTYIRKGKIHNNSSYHRHNIDEHKHEERTTKAHLQVIKPKPLSFSRNSSCYIRGKLPMHGNRINANENHNNNDNNNNNMIHNLHHIEDYQRNIESEKGSDDKVVGCAIVSQAEELEKSREWWESLIEDVEREESDRLWCLGGGKDNEGWNFPDNFWDEQLINYF